MGGGGSPGYGLQFASVAAMACPLDAIDALSTACLLDGVEATLAARTPSTRLHMHSGCQEEI